MRIPTFTEEEIAEILNIISNESDTILTTHTTRRINNDINN